MSIAKITYILTWTFGFMMYQEFKKDQRLIRDWPGKQLAFMCIGTTHVIYFSILGVYFFFIKWG